MTILAAYDLNTATGVITDGTRPDIYKRVAHGNGINLQTILAYTSQTYYTSFWFKPVRPFDDTGELIISRSVGVGPTGGTNFSALYVIPGGALRLYAASGTILNDRSVRFTSVAGAVTLNVWQYLEYFLFTGTQSPEFDGTQFENGTVIVRINGTEYINFTGRVWGAKGPSPAAPNPGKYVVTSTINNIAQDFSDDIMIQDDAGSFMGPIYLCAAPLYGPTSVDGYYKMNPLRVSGSSVAFANVVVSSTFAGDHVDYRLGASSALFGTYVSPRPSIFNLNNPLGGAWTIPDIENGEWKLSAGITSAYVQAGVRDAVAVPIGQRIDRFAGAIVYQNDQTLVVGPHAIEVMYKVGYPTRARLPQIVGQ